MHTDETTPNSLVQIVVNKAPRSGLRSSKFKASEANKSSPGKLEIHGVSISKPPNTPRFLVETQDFASE